MKRRLPLVAAMLVAALAAAPSALGATTADAGSGFRTADIADAFQTYNQSPTVSWVPVKPEKAKILMIALVFSLISSVVIVIGLDSIDDTLRSTSLVRSSERGWSCWRSQGRPRHASSRLRPSRGERPHSAWSLCRATGDDHADDHGGRHTKGCPDESTRAIRIRPIL